MGSPSPTPIDQTIRQLLGYLNFSSGAWDPKFVRNVDQVFRELAAKADDGEDLVTAFFERLQRAATCDSKSCSGAMSDLEQARSVIELTGEHLLPAFLKHHRDLLVGRENGFLFSSYFIAEAMRSLLQSGGPWTEHDRVVSSALDSLNNFLGHRPVAALESRDIEPYPHEWVAPIPVWYPETGACYGPYQRLIEIAVEVLQETDEAILRDAHFSLGRMQVLAIDPRPFDFDHPINRRPNYHFGQWDAHLVGEDGYYFRFIIHRVTLDSLLSRVQRKTAECEHAYADELMSEAGTLLACTMLMAAGISGSGPAAYDSNTTLASLLPIIAGYRDQFYHNRLERLPAKHRQRLQQEAEARRQPFGSARQDLNRELDRQRASQLVNCRLASIFARMGFCDAAVEQSKIVPVASSRILCQIDCLLSSAKQACRKKKLAAAYQIVPEVFQLLCNGVQCGAIVDPWNIIGFDGNYSLFPATENSIPDHRVYELVDLVERILGVCSAIWREAAAANDLETCQAIRKEFAAIVEWWRKYAPHEVMSVDAVDPQEIFEAAELVAEALNLWHQGGAATGNIEFWASHAQLFDSPKAYHLVIEALMDLGDYQTTSALMVHWLSQADLVRLQHGDSSFHNLLWRWITEQNQQLRAADFNARNEIWNRIRKFFDFIEANAEAYGEVPRFELGRSVSNRPETESDVLDGAFEDAEDPMSRDFDEDDSEDDLFGAAYEDFVYRDTTDDGIEGSIFEPDTTSDDEFEAEVDRLFDRLEFLGSLASFWRIAATFPLPVKQGELNLSDVAMKQLANRRDILSTWIGNAVKNRRNLASLLESVFDYRIPSTGVDHESLMQYDRQRQNRDALLEAIVSTCVETEQAVNMLAAARTAIEHLVEEKSPADLPAEVSKKEPLVSLFAAILVTDLGEVKKRFPDAIGFLVSQPLLYVPLDRGGVPAQVVRVRVLQEELRALAGSLPILGLFAETHELMSTALSMERNHKVARGAVTEFDNLYQVAFTSMVKCLIQSTRLFQQVLEASEDYDREGAAEEAEGVLFECVQMLTSSMQELWLAHSRTLRLTVLEKINDEAAWQKLVKFIKRYGSGLFTQQFLHLANARAILHQGAGIWLENVIESPTPMDLRLIDELDRAIPRRKAAAFLTLILEAICENYYQYRDYNSNTTQSDRGELLYTLLDFLRLQSRYDRVCWYLKPVVWGHEILVRDGYNSVARMWRRSLTEKIGPEADKYLEQLEKLRDQYSMQMASIGRRLEGRFVHAMQIDRLRSLVRPAMKNPESRKSQRVFELLQQETRAFVRATPGVGVDLPEWLAALEHEVEQLQLPLRLRSQSGNEALIHPIEIPISSICEELEKLPESDL